MIDFDNYFLFHEGGKAGVFEGVVTIHHWDFRVKGQHVGEVIDAIVEIVVAHGCCMVPHFCHPGIFN